MKRLERLCKVCSHPKRHHRGLKSLIFPVEAEKCNSCTILMMYHRFVLDNLKYLEEHADLQKNKKSV